MYCTTVENLRKAVPLVSVEVKEMISVVDGAPLQSVQSAKNAVLHSQLLLMRVLPLSLTQFSPTGDREREGLV